MNSFFLTLIGLWQSISPQTAFFEQSVELPSGESTIQTEQSWNMVVLENQESLPFIEYKRNGEWKTVHWLHERSNRDTVISTGILFDTKETTLYLRMQKPFSGIIQFFDTQDSLENLHVQSGITDFDTGIEFNKFQFGDALLDGVEITQFQNGMKMGGFKSDDFQPQYITRKGWGADENLRVWKKGQSLKKYFRRTPPEAAAHLPEEDWPVITEKTNEFGQKLTWPIEHNKEIKKVVLHHTGEYIDNTTQMRRTPRDHIRAIYQYHTINKEWGDIGYNFIVDKLGNIYEGRAGGPMTVGAHTAYHNVDTIGIALMGNFNGEEPTDNQLKVVSILLAYLSDKYTIDPQSDIDFLGIQTETITGHRFVARQGHGTACPGTNLVKRLPSLRNAAAEILKTLRNQREELPSGLDFLSKSKNAPDIQKKLPRFVKKEKKDLIEQDGFFPKTILQRGTNKQISIQFTNNSKRNWPAHSSIIALKSPSGMTITPFKSLKEIPIGSTGTFTGLVSTNSTANDYYNVILDPIFLKDDYFEYQTRPTFQLPLQVSGEKNLLQLPRQTQNISFLNKKNSIFSASAFQNKDVFQDTTIKVKLANIDSNKVYIRSNKSIFLRTNTGLITEIEKEKSIQVSVKTPQTLEIKTNEKQWVVEEALFDTEGILEIINYNRGLSQKIPYNKFRRQLNFYPQGGNKLLVVNQLPLEEYLAGLAEEPSTEPLEKKHAIHILARSYAYVYSGERRKFRTHLYDLEDDPKTSQFYLGYDWERYHLDQKKILEETSGMVLSIKGTPVIGPYFTQSSGYSSDKWKHAYPHAKVQELPFDKGLEQKGHGVGLSGNSARVLAKQGKSYKEILNYFFEGVDIKKVY